MIQTLQNKVAIVTGASSGIGRAVAYELSRHGVKQILTGRSQNRLAKLAEELGSDTVAVPADMTSPKDIRSLGDQAMNHF